MASATCRRCVPQRTRPQSGGISYTKLMCYDKLAPAAALVHTAYPGTYVGIYSRICRNI